MEKLPNEMLVNILKYLNTYDLLQFCEAYRKADYLLRERTLIHRVNLSKEFRVKDINLPKFITTRLNPNLIYVLNINSLYWIPSIDLLRVIRKLDNLKELYAVDTKLDLSHNFPEYEKLLKLGLTVLQKKICSNTLRNLKSLFVKIVSCPEDYNLQDLLNDKKMNLEELWIETDSADLNYQTIPTILQNLKKLVIQTEFVSDTFDLRPFGLHLISQFNDRQFFFESVPKIDRSMSMLEPLVGNIEAEWKVLHRYNNYFLCGPKAGKQLFFGRNINNIYLDDMNINQFFLYCDSKFVVAASRILLSKNASQLKRLHFRSCMFHLLSYSNVLAECGFGIKKSQRIMGEKISYDIFDKFAKNVTKLKELEVFLCNECYTKEILYSYKFISAFEHLERLTLQVPLQWDGSFIQDVVLNCKKLSSLRLCVPSPNKKFVSMLYENLNYVTSLKDFRLRYYAPLHIEKLLAGLDGIPSKKLQRMYIKCTHLHYENSNDQIFDEFLKNNPQLVFLFLIVLKHTEEQNSDIQQIFDQHKKGIPAKEFYVTNHKRFPGYETIPSAHDDMMHKRTNVSVINFDEF